MMISSRIQTHPSHLVSDCHVALFGLHDDKFSFDSKGNFLFVLSFIFLIDYLVLIDHDDEEPSH